MKLLIKIKHTINYTRTEAERNREREREIDLIFGFPNMNV